MNKINKTKILKIILTISVLILLLCITIYLFPVAKKIATPEGQIEFKQKVENSGLLGITILFAMQFAQIFLFLLPGEPIEILAGMCYGTFWGTFFIMLSNFIISLSIFMLVRKFGRKFVYSFCDKKQVNKIENSKIFKKPEKVELTLLFLFFVPGTPKDFLVYISGLLPIKKPCRFIVLSTIARFPSVITSTLAGKNVSVGNWKLSIVLYVSIILIVLVILFIFNKFDKANIKDDVITIIKK